MIKSSACLFFLCFIAACSGPAENGQKAQTAIYTDSPVIHKADSVIVTGYYTPVLQEYDAYLKGLDTQKLLNVLRATEQFKKGFDGQPVAVADMAFLLFDAFQARVFAAAEKDTTDLTPLIRYDENGRPIPVSERLQTMQRLLAVAGFQIQQEEGAPVLARDMGYLASIVGEFVSPVLKQYLVQLGKELNEGFQHDAGITIPLTQLADRVVWWEQFSKANPGFIYAAKAAENYHYFLTYLLIGMDNTPVEESGVLAEDFKAAYLHVQQQYNGTATERYITPYLKAYLDKTPAKAKQILEDYVKRKIILYSR
jgi:hypothetical protein